MNDAIPSEAFMSLNLLCLDHMISPHHIIVCCQTESYTALPGRLVWKISFAAWQMCCSFSWYMYENKVCSKIKKRSNNGVVRRPP